MDSILAFLGATTRESAMALGGALSFLGVVLTGGVAIFIWNRNRQKEFYDREALRLEKRQDLLRALWSDIRPVWSGLYLLGDIDVRTASVDAHFDKVIAEGGDFTPFVTKVAGTLFLNEMTKDLVFLEQAEITPIVEFYHQIKTLNQMADDMKTDRFAGLSPDRKRNLLKDLLKLDYRTMISAERALRVLQVSLDLPSNKRLSAMRKQFDADRL